MAPPFRRPIPETIKNVLGSRAGLYSEGNTTNYYKPKTRNTAFCTIKKQGITISTREDTFEQTYNKSTLKPRPNLISRVYCSEKSFNNFYPNETILIENYFLVK